MPLDLSNLQSAIQSRVNALGASSDEKTLLLLSKAIEAAIGNVTVSEINNAAADGVSDIEAKRALEVQAILDAAAARIAAINALDAVLKSGGTMTGDLTVPTLLAGSVTARGASAFHVWEETGAATDAKKWDATAGSGKLAFRIVNDLYSTAKTWMEVGRNAVSAVWVRFTGAVQGNVVPVSAVSNVFTVDARAGNSFDLGTLTAASTLANLTNPPASGFEQQISVRWTQDGTGGRTMSFGGNCINVGGVLANLLPGKTTYAVGKLYSDGKFYYSLVRQP